MQRPMMQVFVKGSIEAVKLYKTAFDADILCTYAAENGGYMHSECKLTGAIITRSYRSTTARSLFQNLISLSDVPFPTRAKLKTKHHGIPNNSILRNLRNRYNLAMCI